jgi:hypothetical protein
MTQGTGGPTLRRDPREMKPDRLTDELEIAVALGRLETKSKAQNGLPIGSLTRRRLVERAKSQGRGGAHCSAWSTPPKVRATRAPKAANPFSPLAFSSVQGADGEFTDVKLVRASIGDRLYRLGLNPLRRPTKNRCNVPQKESARFATPRAEYMGAYEDKCWRN